jgi:cbb3-type cytochrome oxidase subunit 3
MSNWLVLSFILFFIQYSYQIPSKSKRKHSISDSKADIQGYLKECSEIKSCSICSFEELKNEEICQKSGFYLVKQCFYYDEENKLKQEEHEKEDCIDNSIRFFILKFLIFFVSLGMMCFYLRKRQKDKIFGSIFQKLSPGKFK